MVLVSKLFQLACKTNAPAVQFLRAGSLRAQQIHTGVRQQDAYPDATITRHDSKYVDLRTQRDCDVRRINNKFLARVKSKCKMVRLLAAVSHLHQHCSTESS